MKENEKPQVDFNFGDLVRVDGYWPRVFRVLGYRNESYFYPNENWSEIVYELTDASSGEWLEADEADLTLAETADNAEAWLRENPPTQPHTSVKIKPEKPSARELSAQEAEKRKSERKTRAEQIDNLLDIANWNRRMLDKTSDDAYGDRLFAVEAELKKLVETE
jgi:hypothetical protein